MSTTCYIPVKGIDDVIASKVANWSVNRVAVLRGMYDDAHPNAPLDTSNIDEAVSKLVAYRKELAISNAKAINTFGSNLASTYEHLLDTFSAEDRFNRVNMIAYMFSVRLGEFHEANPSLSRRAICNGFTVNGKVRGGQTMLFESLYNEILDYYAEAVEEGETHDADEYRKVIENWPALVAFARMRLRDTEELKLGNKLEYADDANPDNFGDNNLSDLYDAEESKREGWQEVNDYQSSFGSIGKEVRRFLGTLQKIENGEEVVDDLGFPVMLDPVKTHQSLLDILRGASSETKMMSMLREAAQSQEWLNPIIEGLEDDNLLRTQFYVDFKRAFQPYSMLLEKFENGLRVFQTKLLNRAENLLSGRYMTRIMLGKPVNSRNSIYDSKGNINWENLQKLRSLVHEYLDNKQEVFAGVQSSKPAKFYIARGSEKISRTEQKRVLVQMTEALGIDIDSATLDRIMSNPRDLRTLTNNIREAFTQGFERVLNKATLDAMDSDNYSSISSQKYKNVLTAVYAASTAKQGAVKEKIDKILTVVSKNREGLRLENRVRYKDRKGKGVTLFSYVLPSYLSDLMDSVEGYVKARDTQGLRKMLEEKYLNSSYFKDDGVILNKWLEELYNSDLSKDDSFAANFTWDRFLGDENNNFENFTSKKHAIAMLSAFFSDRQISSSSKYAHYPVFILGDSGVSKSIRAKRYSAQEILDGLYNVYRQECRRMSLTKAANEKLKRNGYSTIDNFSEKENEFTLLPFLNQSFKGRAISSISKKEVEDAIRSYMKQAVKDFKTKLDELGVLNTVTKTVQGKEVTSYEYLSQEAKSEEELDKKLADFYWNTKFATIQQLQMMTIDPAYYKGTKDLQKRYKEIHAPGKLLSLEARDFNGELYSADGIERCVYFDDIEVAADPAFLKAIKAHFDEDSRYVKYLSNTLTDGQGYRTLDSYRKVKGMSGEWTREMENAYNEIKSLRSRYGKEDDISPEDLKKIADLAIVFQPIKPYMYTIENYAINNTDVLKIPVQHKYAEAVLIPELLPKGSKLRDMAYWMEEHVDESGKSAPIDLIGSTKIVKVGGFGSTDISKATDSNSLNEALSKAYIHQLSYSDYRIQTNVPEHINSSQLFGTQVRKLIMAHIKENDYHYEDYINGNKVNLGGKLGVTRLNGRNLVSFYNSLIVANILKSYDTFATEASDVKRLSDMLLQTTISNSRESMDNMLAYSLTEDDKFLMPLFEGGLEHDSAAMLFSMFKKMVNKQSIKGGSAVQVSAMGIKGYEKNGDLEYVVDPKNPNNILYAECEIPFDLKFTDASGQEHSLNFNDWCNPDGTLKLGRVVEEDDPQYRDYISYKDENGKVHVPLIEEKFPNILSILAYRIPTERDYSMINLRVKRFSQKTAGGTIKVPAQGTTISGFDFDIDKLYFMRYEFKSRPLSKEDVEKIWKDFYNDNPKVKDALLEARKAEESTQSLIEEIFKPYINSDLAKGIVETDGTKDRLYKYWKEAGLEGSPKEAISKYISANIEKYNTEFISYDYTKPPLDNDRTARNNMLINLIQHRLMDEETFEQRYTPGGFANASKAARFLRELLFGNLEGIVSEGISTSKISGENISSKGSEFAKKLTNPGNNLTVTYKGVTFRNAEHAYQTWKSGEFDSTAYNSNDFIPRGSKPANRQVNFQIMVDILTAKLKQHPELIEGIKERGGYEYIISSTHNVRNDKYWETSAGQNAFIKALAQAAINVGISPINNSSIKSTIDFNAIEERAKDKSLDPEPNYDPSDPMTIITYNQQNQVAGKLIGIFANQNTNHAFASLMQAFYLKNPIAFGEHPEGLSDMLHKTDYEAIDLNVAEFLAASVDAVKDPVLNFLNLNTITADAGAVLARLGYSTRDIGLLFNQPIIKEICEYSFNNGVSTEVAINEILSQYKVDANEVVPEANPKTDLNSAKLASNIVKSRKARETGKDVMEDNSFRTSQLQVAKLFADILRVSGEVSQFVTSSKFTASNAVGSTFGDMYSQQMKVSKYLESFSGKEKEKLSVVMEVSPFIHAPINNDSTLELSNQEYIEGTLDNPFAYEQAMYDMNRRVSKLLSRYYPYNTNIYARARNRMAALTKSGTLDADTINSIHSDLLVYLLAQQEDSLFNGDVPAKDGIPAREYYTKHFAKILFNTLESNPSYKSLPIFQYMQFEVNEESGEVNANIQDIGGLAPYQKDEIRESWAELMEETPDLARDLFMYNYYKLGFTFSPLAFMNLAPTRVKQAIKVGKKWNSSNNTWEDRTYVDFLNDVLAGNLMDKIDINNFVEQYVRNHTDNKKLVFTPSGTALSFIKKLAINNHIIQPTFTLDISKLGEEANIWLLSNPNKKVRAFRPFLMIGDTLYMADNSRFGNFEDFNISTCKAIEYRKMAELGASNKSLQYLSNSNSEIAVNSLSSLIEGSTSAEPEFPPKVPEFDRNQIINEIVKEMMPSLIKYEFIMAEKAESAKNMLIQDLNSNSESLLQAKVQAIRNAVRENGLIVLDEKGNPKQSC